MNFVFFILGFLTAALMGLVGLMAVLVIRGRKPPDQIQQAEFERQLGNLLRYNGTSTGQEGGGKNGTDY